MGADFKIGPACMCRRCNCDTGGQEALSLAGHVRDQPINLFTISTHTLIASTVIYTSTTACLPALNYSHRREAKHEGLWKSTRR